MKYYTNRYYLYRYTITIYDKEKTLIACYDNEWEMSEKMGIKVSSAKHLLGRAKSYQRKHQRKQYYAKTIDSYIYLTWAY